MEAISIRDAVGEDLAGINDIYNHEVLNSIATLDLAPMSIESRLAWFAKFDGENPLLVADCHGAVAGYAYYHFFRDRPGYRATRESSVYVHRDHRGCGIARALYAELLARARAGGVRSMIAVIGGANPASERLHETFGFARVGLLREAGEKFGVRHDVQLWQAVL